MSSDLTALWLSRQAHDLRNRIGVVSAGTSLLDDHEFARDMREASATLARVVERLVTVARIERGEPQDDATMTIAELVQHAVRRARREGSTVESCQLTGMADAQVTLCGVWAERLLADIVHTLASPGDQRCALELEVCEDNEGFLVINGSGGTPDDSTEAQSRSAISTRVASALGGALTLESTDGRWRLQLRLPSAV